MTAKPYNQFRTKINPATAAPKIRFKVAPYGVIMFESIPLNPDMDDETQACIRLWLGKALGILRDIVYPTSRPRDTWSPHYIKRGKQAKTLESINDNIEFLQSEFLEEVLELAGCLELKSEIIEPALELHRFYSQTE